MDSPLEPKVPFREHCSVIHDNILYNYSPDAFQSLPLKEKASWSELPNGVSVSGAACVKGLDNGPGSGQALWVVGGAANKSQANYPGLQKYSFSKKTWKTVEPITTVTKNRRNHAAVFLNKTSQILVYAGSQDDPSIPSIETFALDTTEPYNVLSFSSTNTPVLAPELLQWDDSSAITIGGSQDSKDIYHFGFEEVETGSWTKYDTALQEPMKSRDQERSTLVQGSDRSKVLVRYDLAESPARVSSYVLQDADGKPARTGRKIGTHKHKRTKRDLSLRNWPTYNDTDAPNYTRRNYAIAQSPSGLVAVTGGNDQHPMALFNEQKNEWVDTEDFFGEKDVNAQEFLGPSSTAPTAPPPTDTPLETSTSLPGSDNNRTGVILGSVLGVILGLVAMLVILLLIIRFRRRKNGKAAIAAQQDDEKRRMSFADRGAPYMMEGGAGGEKPVQTHDSVAMMTGKYEASPHRHLKTAGSDSSTSRLVANKAPMPYGSGAVELNRMDDKPGTSMDTTRSIPPVTGSARDPNSSYTNAAPQRTSGWSRYFSQHNTATGAAAGAAAGSRVARKSSGISGRSRRSADTYSNYTTESSHDCSMHGPVEIPPLKMGQEFDGGRVSKLVTGGPPTNLLPGPHGGDRTTGGSLPSVDDRNSRPRTLSSEGSDGPSTIDETLFSKPPTDNHWTTVNRADWSGPKLREAAPSSVYASTPRTSEHGRGLGAIQEDGNLPTQPGAPYQASSDTSSQPPARVSDPDTWPRPPTNAQEHRSVDKMHTIPAHEREPPDIYDEAPSTPTAVTAIPVPASTAMQYTVKKTSTQKPPPNSDMSWLNLGQGAQR